MKLAFRWTALLWLIALPLEGQTPAAMIVGAPRPVTPDGSLFMAPRWSPDGRQLVVTTASFRGVYLVDIDGNGEPVPYGDQTVTGLGVEWSPDGERLLVYLSRQERRRRHGAIGVIDLSTGDLTVLTPFDTRPTGEATWLSGGPQIHLLKGGASQYLAVPGITLNKQPDRAADEMIYYLDRRQVARLALSTGEVAIIEAVPGRKLNLKISPDGAKMVFEIVGGHLWVTAIDGSSPVDLGVGHRPSWAPDGAAIAFQATTDDGHRYLAADIIVVNADGTGRVNITATDNRLEMNPAWSPDGRTIAYDALDTGLIYLQELR